MAQLLLRLTAVICAFALSLCLTWIFAVVTGSKETDRFVISQEAEAGKRVYRKLSETDSYEAHGSLLVSTSSIETSDRMSFGRRVEFHRLAQRAAERMQEMLKNVEVIRKLPAPNEKGVTVGEKLIIRHNVAGDTWLALIWLEGSNLNIVSSDTVVNLLEFEKDHRDYNHD
jgi:hypothetical protein